MRDGPICRTCEVGHLQLVMRRRFGWTASLFGSVLVVVAVASLVVLLFAFFLDARAIYDRLGIPRSVLANCGWFVSSMLLGIIGALASRKESLLACTNCFAISRALSHDEAKESALTGKATAPTESRARA